VSTQLSPLDLPRPALPVYPAVGRSHPHESARAQVEGSADYTDDLPEVQGTLYAAPILSPVAHGRLNGVDASAALAIPGVHGVVLAADVPGPAFAGGEPLFATGTVHYAGQVIGLAVADSVALARHAARQVALDITPLPAVLTVRQALAARHYVLPPVFVRRGDAAAALARAPHRLAGRLEVGGQEHFYLEGQIAYALPLEQGRWWIYASAQQPGEVRQQVAQALGRPPHAVRVECRRLGGGFGGKESQAGRLAAWAAVAANRFGRPVKLRLDRGDDFQITGKRHPFAFAWEAGFDDSGRIVGLKLAMAADCGSGADASGAVADRAVFHADNAYFLQDVEIASYRCRTHTQSHTAFRGLGAPQGAVVIEAILGDIARALGRDALDVRMRNLYGVAERNVTHYQMPVEGNILHELLPKLELLAQYRRRKEAILAWNASHPALQRGIAVTPVKFGISLTPTPRHQAGALVHVDADGSVRVHHGGTEMGQGLHTKVAQTVADELGVPLACVHVTASGTPLRGGSGLNRHAAQVAARKVRGHLAAFVAGLDGCGAKAVRFEGGLVTSPLAARTWHEVVQAASARQVPLWSDGFYRTPPTWYDAATLAGRPFHGFVYGAACTEVAVDTLTGENRVLAVDILFDAGRSINPALDIGQIEGGFVQGMGWLTTERLAWDGAGQLATLDCGTYKIPTAGDVPARLNVTLWPAARREDGAGDGKAVGEPPVVLAISVYEALRDAVASAHGGGASVHLTAPATAENVLRALGRLED